MRLWYRLVLAPGRLLAVVLCGLCRFGWRNLPKRGPFLLVSNHQSYLDLYLITACLDYEITYVAREELFKSFVFNAITFPFHKIKIKRSEADLSAIKGIVGTLRSGRPVLMFPEGTRTRDGKLGRFKGGFAIIAREANVPIVPTLITGAFQILPRKGLVPRPGRVCVTFLRPISSDANRQGIVQQVETALSELLHHNPHR